MMKRAMITGTALALCGAASALGPVDDEACLRAALAGAGVTEDQIANEWGELNPAIEAWLAANPNAPECTGTRDSALQEAESNRAEYLANVERMGKAPDPTLLAIFDEAVVAAGGAPGPAPAPVRPPTPAAEPDPAPRDMPVPSGPANLANAASEAELLALLATVPQAHQPIAVRVESYLEAMSGSHIVYPVYLFADGQATDCHTTDPRTLNIAAAVRDSDGGCDIMRWRKRGADYETLTQGENEWDLRDISGGTEPFKRGARLDFSLGATDGFSMNTGVGSTTSISYDGLTMRPDGTMTMDSSFVVTHSGAGAVGYGAGEQGPRTYRYAVDGYVIAMDDGTGPKLMYIAPVFDVGRIFNVYFADNFYYSD